MNADTNIQNAILLLKKMLQRQDDLLTALPTWAERVALRDGLVALQTQARNVYTFEDLLNVAVAVRHLVERFPALQSCFLANDHGQRHALPEMLPNRSKTRQEDYVMKHKPAMINGMVQLTQELNAAIQRTTPPPRPPWWQRWLGRGPQ